MNNVDVLGLVTEAFGGRGGISAVTRDVIKAWSSGDAESRLHIIPRNQPDDVGELPERVTQTRAQSGRVAYSLSAVMAALRLRPRIVYCNHLYMAPLAYLIERLVGARLIVHLHGVEIWKPPTAAQKQALEGADVLLCVSRHTRAQALTFADVVPERALVLNNCVGPEFTPGDRQAARQRFGLKDEKLLLTVARLAANERYKGHDRVITALPEILKSMPNTVYWIAGDGDDRRRLETLAASIGIAEQVRFLGSVQQEQLPELYRAADLFVMPSTGEGFGIAFLEALASGVLAVGLCRGGAADVLGEDAVGIATTEEELPNTIVRALCNRDPLGAREALARSVRARFGYDLFSTRLKALLDIGIQFPPVAAQ